MPRGSSDTHARLKDLIQFRQGRADELRKEAGEGSNIATVFDDDDDSTDEDDKDNAGGAAVVLVAATVMSSDGHVTSSSSQRRQTWRQRRTRTVGSLCSSC